jgi:hypothetical protein
MSELSRRPVPRRAKPGEGTFVPAHHRPHLANSPKDPPGPGQRRPNHDRTFFIAGQVIPDSGIYEVIHEGDHRPRHDSVLVKGDRFPFCETCNERVRFRVLRTAPYIFHDPDFE